jgi:pantetheine-phosphate adenylyltransferase
MKRTAVIPGSFDPLTKGHEALVLRARDVFDKVTVLVCNNFDKNYLFSFSERLEIARESFRGVEGVEVESHSSWLYEYLNAHPDSVLVKGIRTPEDLEYERKMALFNFEKSGVETLFFASSDSLSDISSTRVRQALSSKDGWRELIPQNAQKSIEKFYAEKCK